MRLIILQAMRGQFHIRQTMLRRKFSQPQACLYVGYQANFISQTGECGHIQNIDSSLGEQSSIGQHTMLQIQKLAIYFRALQVPSIQSKNWTAQLCFHFGAVMLVSNSNVRSKSKCVRENLFDIYKTNPSTYRNVPWTLLDVFSDQFFK